MNRKISADLARYIADTYGVTVDLTALAPVVDQIDTTLLGSYFGKDGDWTADYDKFTYTGWGIAERVNLLQPERVLDVGCGDNLLKPLIPNLYGIDPYNENADENVGIDDFQSEHLWDVVLCLGSINFGDDATIFKQVEKVVSLVKPGGAIFFRYNPGLTHPRASARWIDFYDWDEAKIRNIAQRVNCEVAELAPDYHRLYSLWIKK